MDDDCRAIGIEQRIGLALDQRDHRIGDLDDKFAVRRNVQVGHVAGMGALLGFHAVLVVAGIEMRSCAGERRLALADCVDMEGALARRCPLQRHLQENTMRCLRQLDLTDVLALGILQRRLGTLSMGGERHQAARH
jgi:hypothetical protein